MAGGPLKPEFCLRGIPPPLVGVAGGGRQAALLSRHGRQPLGGLLAAAEWKPPSLLEGAPGKVEGLLGGSASSEPAGGTCHFHRPDVASSPAGLLVGTVTSQISTIHLTRPTCCPASTASSPLSPSDMQMEESESGESQLSG